MNAQAPDETYSSLIGLTNQNVVENLRESVQFLSTYASNIFKLFETEEPCKHAARVLICLKISTENIKEIEIAKEYKLLDLIINTIDFLNTDNACLEILKTQPVRSFPKELYCFYEESSIDERKVYILCHFLNTLNALLPSSSEFRVMMNDKPYLSVMAKLFKSEELLGILDERFPSYLGNLVFCINWMSKEAEAYKSNWHELNLLEYMFKYAKKFPRFALYLYMMSANVAYDKEIEDYPDIMTAIDSFVSDTNECVTTLGWQTTNLEFVDDSDPAKPVFQFDVSYYHDTLNNATVSLTGLLLAIYRIAVNNKVKLEIFQKPGLFKSLIQSIKHGNEVEQQYAVQVLAQLSFDNQVNALLRKETALCELVEEISKKPDIKFGKLRKTCQQLIWLLKEMSDKEKEPKTEETETSEKKAKHIMISYNTGSRDLCLKIKESLEACKMKVWIDVEEIHGSSLDSMAKAVENAEIVLICVTEKYRQSLNCQAEAQYAFRINKKIIPLIMQKGYGSVDGWLGIIIGDKIFIDFTKYEFNDAINRLVRQIVHLKSDSTNNHPSVPEPLPIETRAVNQNSLAASQGANSFLAKLASDDNVKQINRNEAEEWNESRVEIWFKDNNLNKLLDIVKPVDGKTLYQLAQIQLYTPEFFYKSFSNNPSIDIKLAAEFAAKLRDLFKN